jgi:hypothetical protein
MRTKPPIVCRLWSAHLNIEFEHRELAEGIGRLTVLEKGTANALQSFVSGECKEVLPMTDDTKQHQQGSHHGGGRPDQQDGRKDQQDQENKKQQGGQQSGHQERQTER